MRNYLNFEADIKKLENELDQLKDPFDNDGITEVNTDKITKIQKPNQHNKYARRKTQKQAANVHTTCFFVTLMARGKEHQVMRVN